MSVLTDLASPGECRNPIYKRKSNMAPESNDISWKLHMKVKFNSALLVI